MNRRDVQIFLMMIVLFTSIFTMMSVIEDRNEGFLLSVIVAPVHRSGIMLSKVLGKTTLSTIQGLLFLVFAPFIGLKIGIEQFLIVVLVTFLVAFSLTALGFVITALAARFIRHEEISALRWGGVVLIVIGAILVAWSEKHKKPSPDSGSPAAAAAASTLQSAD